MFKQITFMIRYILFLGKYKLFKGVALIVLILFLY